MKRVLLLDEEDFLGDARSLSTLKENIKRIEPEFDDIFYNSNNRIICFKARNNKAGEYSIHDFNNYLLKNII
jgi:hypothetical protein